MPCRTPGVRALAFSFRAAEWYDFCSLHLVRALVGALIRAHGKSAGPQSAGSAWAGCEQEAAPGLAFAWRSHGAPLTTYHGALLTTYYLLLTTYYLLLRTTCSPGPRPARSGRACPRTDPACSTSGPPTSYCRRAPGGGLGLGSGLEELLVAGGVRVRGRGRGRGRARRAPGNGCRC